MSKFRRMIAALLLSGLLAACSFGGNSGSQQVTTYDASATTLNIVAGSEQKQVFQTVVQPWCASQGFTCNYIELGSVDQARQLAAGNSPYDAYWFASSVFAQMGDQAHVLKDVKPTFVSPVVFAGWKSEMQRLGFIGHDVKLADILKAVESKQTTAWQSNPTQSNSGASVLLEFLNYFAGNKPGQPLTQQQLDSDQVKTGMTRLAQAFAHTSASTGTLMDECVAHDQQCKTLFTYEDLVVEQNQKLPAGHEPLVAVYPTDGLAISDSPLGFLPHGNNTDKEQTFLKLQSYLSSADAQKKLLDLGRRPNTTIGLSLPPDAPKTVFNPDWGIQAELHQQTVTFPAADVIQSALNNYQTTYRTPDDAVYCVDGSGSMGDNGGWDGINQAAGMLFDPQQARQYLLQINPKDRTTVMIFNDVIKGGPWTVNGNDPNQLLDLKSKIQQEGPGGGTAILLCLHKAAEHFKATPADGRRQIVILMTDGYNNVDSEDGVAELAEIHVPVVAIGFGGDTEPTALQDIANRTNGTYLKAPTPNDLPTALREATSYK